MPAVFLPFVAEEKGLTPTEGAVLVTVAGGLDIVSRMVPGVLAQSGLVKPRTSVLVSLVLLGVLFQWMRLANGMVALTLVSVVYGLLSGVFFSMQPLLLLDLLDADMFRKVLGVSSLAMGLSGATGYPIVGFLTDSSGSYVTSFHFMAVCGLLAAIILAVIPFVKRWEDKRRGGGQREIRILKV